MVGPSGGHLFPFLRLAKYLRAKNIELPFVFAGWLSPRLQDILLKENIPFLQLPLRRRSEGKASFYSHLLLSFLRFFPQVKRRKPACIISSGGYPSFIGGMTARLKGIPLIIYEPNIVPGKANLYLARWASAILTGFPETSLFFPENKTTTVGIPVGNPSPPPKHPPTLLILGGSQGAHFLNTTLPVVLRETLPPRFHIVHISGERDYQQVKELYANAPFPCKIYPFYYPMDELYAKTGYCISRGGAITLSELSAWDIPTLIFPLLTSYTSHQLDNAYHFKKFASFAVGKEDTVKIKVKEFISSPPEKKNTVKRERIPEGEMWKAMERVLS